MRTEEPKVEGLPYGVWSGAVSFEDVLNLLRRHRGRLEHPPHCDASEIIGNITSPSFGFANQLAGGPNGEGFYENANNRRLESQISLLSDEPFRARFLRKTA